MSHHSSVFPRVLIIGACAVLLLFAVALRLFPQSSVRVAADAYVSSVATSTDGSASSVPAFTSAAFTSGDALKGLGPEWTYVRQSTLSPNMVGLIAGTAPTRETVVKLIGKDVGYFFEEADIQDPKVLDAALKGKDVHAVNIAERDGYLIPMGDIAGGTGFLLKGATSILVIQDVNAATWPSELPSELLSYIHTVHVP